MSDKPFYRTDAPIIRLSARASRRPTYLLLAVLIVLAVLLGSVGVDYSAKQVAHPAAVQEVATGGKLDTGELLVATGLNETDGNTGGSLTTGTTSCTPLGCGASGPRTPHVCFNPPYSLPGFSPLANVSASVIGVGGPPLVAIKLSTDVCGEAHIDLPPGDVTVTFSSPLFTESSSVSIQTNNVTEVIAVVHGTAYSIAFGSVPEDGSTGSMAPWDHAYAVVKAPAEVFTNSSSFSLGTVLSIPVFGCPIEGECNASYTVGVLPGPFITLSSVSPGANDSALVRFQPEGFMPIAEVGSAAFVAYYPSINVTVYEP